MGRGLTITRGNWERTLYFISSLQHKEMYHTLLKDLSKTAKNIKLLKAQQSGIFPYIEHPTHTIRQKRRTATYALCYSITLYTRQSQ